MNQTITPPRLLPPHLFLASLIVMAALALLPGAGVLPGQWKWLGLVPLAAGLGLTLSAARRFARVGTGIVPFSESTVLVETGAFAFTRNPMYLGILLALVGVALLLDSPWPWLVPPLLFAVLRQRFVIREEAHMRRTFGARYEAYCARVRRWV